MRRRLATLLSAALVAAGMATLVPARPAAATGVCTGLGNLTTGAPLTFPITALLLDPSLPHPLHVTVHQPVTTGFVVSFPVGTCINTNGAATTTKTLTATGVVSGWCGLLSGFGVTGDGFRFAVIMVGTAVIHTGGLNGLVTGIPDTLAGQSCNRNKGSGATQFIVGGATLKTHCTISKQKGLTTVPAPASLATVNLLPIATVGVHTGAPHIWWKLCPPTPLL